MDRKAQRSADPVIRNLRRPIFYDYPTEGKCERSCCWFRCIRINYWKENTRHYYAPARSFASQERKNEPKQTQLWNFVECVQECCFRTSTVHLQYARRQWPRWVSHQAWYHRRWSVFSNWPTISLGNEDIIELSLRKHVYRNEKHRLSRRSCEMQLSYMLTAPWQMQQPATPSKQTFNTSQVRL